MSIDRQHGFIIFSCDYCEDTCETETRSWERALEKAKEEGFRIVPDQRGGFKHFCKTC